MSKGGDGIRAAGEIGGILAHSDIGVIDVNGDIVDVNTASKKPAGVRTNYRVQIARYATPAPGASKR